MPRAEVVLSAVIDPEIMGRHSAASPQAVGIELAHQVLQAVQAEKLNYIPALDHFRDNDRFDSDLLEVYDSLTRLGEQLTKTELRTRLRSVFAQIESVDIRAQSETLTKLKPDGPNTKHQLAEHYTPNHYHIHIKGILTPRMKDTPLEGAMLFALRDSFSQLQCLHTKPLN